MSEYTISDQAGLKKVGESILNQVMETSKSLIKTFEVHMIYSSKVTEKQEEQTLEKVKRYRALQWKKALVRAKGNRNLAYSFYTANLKELL